MAAIDVIVPSAGIRRWQAHLIERLGTDGHDVACIPVPAPSCWAPGIEQALRLERTLLRRSESLTDRVADEKTTPHNRPAALTVDLSGAETATAVPCLALRFADAPVPGAAIEALVRGTLPELSVVDEHGDALTRASPMVDNPAAVSLALEDVLARAITLLQAAVRRWDAGLPPMQSAQTAATAHSGLPGALVGYGTMALPRLGREVLRRLRYRQAHWRVGYRFIDGPGVANTGTLGVGWSVIGDDGERFLADPFPFEWEGRHYIFVEDYPHATGKAVISVLALDQDGRPGRPETVLEEGHHLSYPQVFARDGQIWMIPESSAASELVLYRAQPFPYRWVRHAVLIEGTEISDATFLDHQGSLYLFGTAREGSGSTSDTMVVFMADFLGGPWTAHPLNPIIIDRASARPGGAFVRGGAVLRLPVQDGTKGYGSGLGMLTINRLDPAEIELGTVAPVSARGDWPYPMIHTLNRAGRLEVIDGIAHVRRS